MDLTDSNLSRQVLQQIKCCICMEVFDDPTSLPCGHTFCYKCLIDIAKHKKRVVKNPYIVMEMSIPCPHCRFPVPYPNLMTKTNGVVANFVLKSVIELFMQGSEARDKVDAATNTDTLAYSEQRMKHIAANLDAIMSSVRQKGSVIQDCRDEIDVIRKNYENCLHNQADMHTDPYPTELITVHPPPSFPSHNPVDPGDLDPAILSIGSSSHTASELLQQTQSTDMINMFTRYNH